MQDFVHLHVHTQYSVLDGQAAVPKLVDKAIKDGMRGMAVTDHGNMFAIKEFFNYVNKVKGKAKGVLKSEESTPEEKEKAQKVVDFKPIIGCEVYCARRAKNLREGKQDLGGWHLILLAKNEVGYHNLIKIVSRAWVDGFYGHPRTDHEDLEKYHDGLIVCSACIAGEVPSKVLRGDIEGAEASLRWFKGIWGEDYYLELQRHQVTDPAQNANRETFPLQQQANNVLIELAHKCGVKLVCTNDVHFVEQENAEAHDRLICLSTGRDLDDPNRMLYSKQEWFKTKAEMNEIFADVPEALANTCEIVDKVEVYSIDHAPIMPNFEIPKDFGTEEEYRQRLTEKDLFDEFTQDENGNVVLSQEDAEAKIQKLGGYDKLYRIKFEADYLAKLAYEGAKWRYGDPLSDEVAERIKFELHIMKTMGFPGYFLIVQDYIRAAREELDVSVGPGRGSAAGSAVAYCLRITDIDPIKYDLLFERFLNPDRISLPDIDVDFDDDGRGRVLNWVTEKYGAEKVAHIITYGTMATKLAIKDVGRVQKLPLSMTNNLCKLIPDKLPEDPKTGKSPKMNLPNAIAAIPELREAEASDNRLLADTIRYAKMLEGNVRNTGVHACGTIICRDDISDWVPVSTADDKETGGKLRCTQYEGSVIEETGLIKMDFLGLKTLSILREAIANIKLSLGIDVNIDEVSIEDPATYQLYCDGLTIGTFQFESPGMQKYLRELQPSTFEDLIAMNALYRPGPMAYIPQFIARKQGREPITYDLPCMEKFLKDTYGITVYQEQVMLLSREIANFTRGESDTLRKAMGKKLIDKLNHMHPKFVAGGKANGYDPAVLDKIWEDWKAFASYAFNKSHATCYSWVAYQTAYLKANFPSQYMAAVMSRSLGNISDITKLMDESKAMGIETLCPDLNESYLKFSVNETGNIRFGMAAIKGVGEAAARAVIDARTQGGPFLNLYDFFERVNLKACNRKNIENLILSGAFDTFTDIAREQYFVTDAKGVPFLDTLVAYGTNYQIQKQEQQHTFFGGFDDLEIAKPVPPADFERWSDLTKLGRECELIGVYISGHPLDEYRIVLTQLCTHHMAQWEQAKTAHIGTEIKIGGIVLDVREGTTRNGKPYGAVRIEDYSGSAELMFWGDDWAKWRAYLAKNSQVFITATIQPARFNPEMGEIAYTAIKWLSDVKDQLIERITLTLSATEVTDDIVEELATLIHAKPGNTSLYINIHDTISGQNINLVSKAFNIALDNELLNFLEARKGSIDYKLN